MAELDNQLRLITYFQISSDRATFANFMDTIKALGYKQGSDFWVNPGGDPSVMMKEPVAKDAKVIKAREKFNMGGFSFENQEAGKNIKESTYVVGEKVKVWMGGGKKALGEVKKIAFGDGFYFVEVAGKVVSRSLHELEPFTEGKDKLVKVAKKTLSLDEAVLEGLEEKEEVTEEITSMDEDFNEGIIDESDYEARKTIIGREKGNMSVDEMVDEAMDMTETSAEYKKTEDGAPDFGSEEDEEEFEGGDEEEGDNKGFGIGKRDVEEEGMELGKEGENDDEKRFMMYLKGATDNFPIGDGHAVSGSVMNEFEGAADLKWIKVTDSKFILAVAYDEEMSTMYIRFAYGVYEYYDVPEDVFTAFVNSPSMGKFFHANIIKTFAFNLAKKYDKTYGKNMQQGRKNSLAKRALGEEEGLSDRDSKVQFIIDNCDYIPEGHPLKALFWDDATRQQAIEKLAMADETTIEQLYRDIEDTKETEQVDYKVDEIVGENFSEGETMEEGKDKEIVKEAKSTKRFPILKEDVETVKNIAALKGYKVLAVQGELLESRKDGIMNILVEKNGRKAVIVYNDNINVKPWSWNGTKFNFMQEALDTVYVTTKQILSEGKVIERNELKENSKKVDQLLEQRKFADKTTKLSETETTRRKERSNDLLKKFLGDDLANRKFDR